MSYNFTLTKKVGKWEVNIDPEAMYGYFEHDDFGEGGGLWFNEAKELVDYDGVMILPKNVEQAIHEAGYKLEDDDA